MELGGGVTRSSVTTKVDNPYTISNLWYNCKVNAYVNVEDPRTVITSMTNYAGRSIPNFQYITEIPSGHLPTDINTSLVTSFRACFFQCFNLITLPDPFYDTSNTTDMKDMFLYCQNIITVPKFDTSKITSAINMFHGCTNLTTIPNFNTSKVTNMQNMFAGCISLTTIPNIDTGNVTDMEYMFTSCRNLTTIPILNTSSVSYLYYVFAFCANIKGDFYIESNNVRVVSGLFANASNYIKNIYCHANTNTYNKILGNNMQHNPNWNTYLYTMEDNYAEIPWNGAGIYRFPTNKVQLIYTDNTSINVIEVSPYTDYNLSTNRNSTVTTYAPYVSSDIIHNGTVWGTYAGTIKFRFFKDITNMTPDIIDTI